MAQHPETMGPFYRRQRWSHRDTSGQFSGRSSTTFLACSVPLLFVALKTHDAFHLASVSHRLKEP